MSSGYEPKIYLRGIMPLTHTWWLRPPTSSHEELDAIGFCLEFSFADLVLWETYSFLVAFFDLIWFLQDEYEVLLPV